MKEKTTWHEKTTLRPSRQESLRRQCKLLQLNRSGLYQRKTPIDDTAKQKREDIMNQIDRLHNEMPAIGSRKITVLLAREGYSDIQFTLNELYIRLFYVRYSV